MTPRRLLAIDTATHQATLAVGELEGALVAVRAWEAGHGHSATLLPNLDALLAETGTSLGDLGGVVAGTGPGSFTGLRVGLATAKVLAYTLDVPIVGVSTAEALALAPLAEPGTDARATTRQALVVQPAGPGGSYVTGVERSPDGRAVAVSGPELRSGSDPVGSADSGSDVVALGSGGAAFGPEAEELGRRALDGLGSALLTIGSGALLAGRADDVAELVPAYVTLPRGVREVAAEIQWSPVPR